MGPEFLLQRSQVYRFGTRNGLTGVLDVLWFDARQDGCVRVTTGPVIAVVDDDQIYTEMIRNFLDGEGFDTILIQVDATAVETIVRARPALALLDVRMDVPESGATIPSELRNNPVTRDLPVIVCAPEQQFLSNRAAFLKS